MNASRDACTNDVQNNSHCNVFAENAMPQFAKLPTAHAHAHVACNKRMPDFKCAIIALINKNKKTENEREREREETATKQQRDAGGVNVSREQAFEARNAAIPSGGGGSRAKKGEEKNKRKKREKERASCRAKFTLRD